MWYILYNNTDTQFSVGQRKPGEAFHYKKAFKNHFVRL